MIALIRTAVHTDDSQTLPGHWSRKILYPARSTPKMRDQILIHGFTFFMLHPMRSVFVDNQLALIAQLQTSRGHFLVQKGILLAPLNQRGYVDVNVRRVGWTVPDEGAIPVNHPRQPAGVAPSLFVFCQILGGKSSGVTGMKKAFYTPCKMVSLEAPLSQIWDLEKTDIPTFEELFR